ncbi:hypothetical protein [Halomonas sp.]|uniref:hypothetical protein n=1 Tax=Halomonas sp. TaxID=1486246 RepID=UPI003D128439
MEYTLAMDDQLLKLFTDFKRGRQGETSSLLIQNLLRMYHPPHITSAAQLKAAGVEDPALLQQLASANLIRQTAEELVALTRYKILLSAEDIHYPAVRISGDSVSNQFVMTLKPGDNRTKAHDWFRALLADAKTVTVADRYLCDETSGRLKPNARKFFQLLPKRALSVFVPRSALPVASEIKQICPSWKVKQDTSTRYSSAHDRYVLIDGQLEIVVTSGIDYLFDTAKECSLLVRSAN